MNLPTKILVINVGLAVIFSILLATTFGNLSTQFFIAFGLTGLFGGLIDLIAGLFLLIKEDKRYAQGFLLSGGVLMLLGFVSCSAFSGMV